MAHCASHARAVDYRPFPDPFFSLDARSRNSFPGHPYKRGTLSLKKPKKMKNAYKSKTPYMV
jgi:energy-converting hydrogenase Eha subunit F